jgi:hypothetical protein
MDRGGARDEEPARGEAFLDVVEQAIVGSQYAIPQLEAASPPAALTSGHQADQSPHTRLSQIAG